MDGPQFTTDKEGRFRVEGLVPGLKYSFFQFGKKTMRQAYGFHPGTLAEPGKHKDLGDIKEIAID
jgi:hypothetical protein